MRIDVHTHIFTLESILTREAIRVITQRLVDKGVPAQIADAVGDFLDEKLSKPGFLNEHRILRELIRKITGIDDFDDLLGQYLAGSPIEVTLQGDLDEFAADQLSDLLTELAEKYEGGGKAKTILNVIESLRQSMQPTITHIADDLLAEMDDDGVIVALMMDIHGENPSDSDRRKYLMQIAGTAEAALQRPGRVLPFFGVHPDREGFMDELRAAVEQKGFVGVKLYPSLGYSVDSDHMREVYRYCLDMDLPVLLHCGHGGFYRTEEKKQLCDPAQWTQVLQDFPGLRVCFAHFGGWEALAKRHCLDENWPPDVDPAENWGKKIYDFMLQYPNVYTDLAKHVNMFEEAEHTETYFDTMRELIADPRIGKRIIFGTDAWLLRLDMPFEDYWRQWREASGDAWDDITVESTKAFLGFPGEVRAEMTGNVERFVGFMRDNRERVGRDPAPWLAELIDEPFTVARAVPEWDFSKTAVRDTWQFLSPDLTDEQADDFDAARLIQLNQLPYFDTNDPNFAGRCRDMASRLVDFADQDVDYAGDHDFDSAVDLFIEIFTKGDFHLWEVAMALDAVIDYPEPVA